MHEKKVDRRVLRTKQLLKDALLTLIQEKGFETLTVQDLLDRANVGRSTFYAHFQGKEDLLLQGLDTLRGFLLEEQRQALFAKGIGQEQRAFFFRHALFAHCHEQRGVFRALVGRNSGLMMQRHFQQTLLELVRAEIHAMTSTREPGATVLEALAQFIAGGMYGMLAGWMDGRMKMTAEEMSDQFWRFAMSALREGFHSAQSGEPGAKKRV